MGPDDASRIESLLVSEPTILNGDNFGAIGCSNGDSAAKWRVWTRFRLDQLL